MIHLILDIIAYTLLALITYQLHKQGAFKIVYHNAKIKLKLWYYTTYIYKTIDHIKHNFNHVFFKKRTIKKRLEKMHKLTPAKGQKEYIINGYKINGKTRKHANTIYNNIVNFKKPYSNKKH